MKMTTPLCLDLFEKLKAEVLKLPPSKQVTLIEHLIAVAHAHAIFESDVPY